MSSSAYPMLDDKPIDKLKVTELREELKKRSLPTKGLKEELIRRLAEAMQEAEEEEEEASEEAEEEEEANQEAEKEEEETNHESEKEEEEANHETKEEEEANHETKEEEEANHETKEEEEANHETKEEEANQEAEITLVASVEAVLSTETTTVVTETTETEASDAVETVTEVDDVREIAGLEKSSEPVIQNKEPPVSELAEAEVDEKSSAAKSNEQVSSSEVKPVKGTEVKKSDCISTDSVSNNEKIELELKDNEIAGDNDVKLDQQNVSKSPTGGESHPMDVEEPLEQQKKKISGGENNVIVDSEKLNLDRSSGDDESMEDEPETKQTESVTSDEVVNDKSEKTDMVIDNNKEEETHAADINDAKKGEAAPVVASEKRKLPTNDQEAVVKNEPAKRQRRWNSESVKVPEVTNNVSAAAPTTITPRSIGLKRDFARSDSSVSEDGPKERVVPPSPKAPTNSLRIDRFLRPFTLKAVQELLGKTGNVTSFWMDHIKTHCYVSYASVEEAAATREAVYNLQWPPNGGRFLTAEFVGEAEVKAKLEPPQVIERLPPPPPPQTQAQPLVQPQALPPPPPLVKPPQVIERLPPPPPHPPVVVEELEAPIVTLDDLFKKTKAIPRIYYLPLSEEQVAAKLAANNNK